MVLVILVMNADYVMGILNSCSVDDYMIEIESIFLSAEEVGLANQHYSKLAVQKCFAQGIFEVSPIGLCYTKQVGVPIRS